MILTTRMIAVCILRCSESNYVFLHSEVWINLPRLNGREMCLELLCHLFCPTVFSLSYISVSLEKLAKIEFGSMRFLLVIGKWKKKSVVITKWETPTQKSWHHSYKSHLVSGGIWNLSFIMTFFLKSSPPHQKKKKTLRFL